MPIPVTIPRLGWNMEEGTFVEWLKADGDVIKHLRETACGPSKGCAARYQVPQFSENADEVTIAAAAPGATVQADRQRCTEVNAQVGAGFQLLQEKQFGSQAHARRPTPPGPGGGRNDLDDRLALARESHIQLRQRGGLGKGANVGRVLPRLRNKLVTRHGTVNPRPSRQGVVEVVAELPAVDETAASPSGRLVVGMWYLLNSCANFALELAGVK